MAKVVTEHDYQRGIEVLRNQIDAKIASYLSSCVGCGLCAEACLFYTETGDPRYTPIYKVEPMRRLWQREQTVAGKIGKALGFGRDLSEADFAEWQEMTYDSCTLCGRCSMVCPVGNDITYMIRKQREAFSAAGYTPKGLQAASTRALEIGSPMGLTFKALAAQIKHVEKATGLTVPVDREGVDYMALLSSMEVINFPEYIEALTRIFDAAGVTWTLSSKAFEATNSGIQIGSSEIAKELVSRVVDAAEGLGVKYVISPECGHAYTAIRWDGPNLIGRPYEFEVVHILELLDQLRQQGRLQTEGIDERRLTFHDPCQIVRRGGVEQEPRNLLNMVAPNFEEMPDHGKMNWCCGGGGGLSANEEAHDLRTTVFKAKKRQIEAVGVETMVTACANCRIVMEEALEHYEMPVVIEGVTELLAAHLKPKMDASPSAD
ncbi:MAG: heterodisulfide reductase [Gammaproteobacteria bacterium]|nr:MAG: heterodisulfide reductase [Gammaproteobacteria bacterium]